MNEERVKKLVRELIIEIGEDPTREGLRNTPERIANMYKEIFSGYDSDSELSVQFSEDSDFVDSKHYEKLIIHAMKCLESSINANKTTYIKIVVSSKTQLNEFNELIKQIFKIISKDNIDGFIIQPTYGISEPSLDLLLNLYDLVYPYYIDVKVVPQLHKFIGAP